MPAIHLPRLQQQVEGLIEHYADAEKFSRQLRDLFNYYGDKTRRPSQKGKKAFGLPSENVPAPVLRQVVMQLTPYAENTPHAILNLSRSLWKHPILEYRQLAAMLIGKIPVSNIEETLNLIQKWILETPEEDLLSVLAANSLASIRQEAAEVLLERIEKWLAPEKEDLTKSQILAMQKLGLHALLPFIQDPEFENLPRIYALVKPLLRDSAKALRPYLLDLLLPLAGRSPQEVAYILRSMLEEDPNPHLSWLARRTMEALPPENRERLRPLVSPRREE